MVISNSTLDECRRYKEKIETTNDETEKLLYEAAKKYSQDVRKNKTAMLQKLLDDTKLMINEKKKAKRLNMILLTVIFIMVGSVIALLIFNGRNSV